MNISAKSDERQLLHLTISFRDSLDSAPVVKDIRDDHELSQQPPGWKQFEHGPNARPLAVQQQKQNPAPHGVEEFCHRRERHVLQAARLQCRIAHLDVVVDIARPRLDDDAVLGNFTSCKPLGHETTRRDGRFAARLILERADEQPRVPAAFPNLERLFTALFGFRTSDTCIVGDFAPHYK